MKDTVLQNRIYRHKQTARNILGNTEAVLETAAAMESCGSRASSQARVRGKQDPHATNKAVGPHDLHEAVRM